MPTGEQPPNGLPATIVEIAADVYTELLVPLFPAILITLAVFCVLRITMRSWRERRPVGQNLPRGPAAEGPD